jgi:predicted acetyltransferase
MNYATRIKRELFNDKAFQALYGGLKPEEKEQIEKVVENFVSLAEGAIIGFSAKTNNSTFTQEEIDAAINDRTGRK